MGISPSFRSIQDELMRVIIILFAFLLFSCSVNYDQGAAGRVHSFYSSYLMSRTCSDIEYPQSELHEYVSADTLWRLEAIEAIPEQGLLEDDYFTYSQDYDPSWISALTVGAARPVLGGEVLPVWIGVEDGKKVELEVYVRHEAGKWKIYRVRDVTDDYEHPIFNAGAINWQKSAAANGL